MCNLPKQCSNSQDFTSVQIWVRAICKTPAHLSRKASGTGQKLHCMKSHPKSIQTLHLRVNIYLINNLQNLTDLIYVRRASLLNILQIFFVHNVIHIKISTVLK